MSALVEVALLQRWLSGHWRGATVGEILAEDPHARAWISYFARQPSGNSRRDISDLEAAAAFVVAGSFGWISDDERDECVDLAEAVAALLAIGRAEAAAA